MRRLSFWWEFTGQTPLLHVPYNRIMTLHVWSHKLEVCKKTGRCFRSYDFNKHVLVITSDDIFFHVFQIKIYRSSKVSTGNQENKIYRVDSADFCPCHLIQDWFSSVIFVYKNVFVNLITIPIDCKCSK